MKIFIGFDSVETIAYHALVQSIINHATVPVEIIPLKLSMLPNYKRPRDERQSNEFSFSRFLVPHLCDYKGVALFMDCDMIFRTDPKELFDLMEPDRSVMVVKHDYTPKTTTKYLGNVQYKYPRKNWSSVMLFNCEHPDCRHLTPGTINEAEGAYLHRFAWTEDRFIGELSKDWNHLVGEYEPNQDAKIVHWTVGGPYFEEYRNTEFAEEWVELANQINRCDQLENKLRHVAG